MFRKATFSMCRRSRQADGLFRLRPAHDFARYLQRAAVVPVDQLPADLKELPTPSCLCSAVARITLGDVVDEFQQIPALCHEIDHEG